MSAAACEFPNFRRAFLGASQWAAGPAPGQQAMDGPGGSSAAGPGPGSARQKALPRTLDLANLPREDAPTESVLRRQKYLFFEKQCSEVAPGLFLAGDYVAKNRDILRANTISHVVNCVGFICKEYFKGELAYRTYFLQGPLPLRAAGPGQTRAAGGLGPGDLRLRAWGAVRGPRGGALGLPGGRGGDVSLGV